MILNSHSGARRTKAIKQAWMIVMLLFLGGLSAACGVLSEGPAAPDQGSAMAAASRALFAGPLETWGAGITDAQDAEFLPGGSVAMAFSPAASGSGGVAAFSAAVPGGVIRLEPARMQLALQAPGEAASEGRTELRLQSAQLVFTNANPSAKMRGVDRGEAFVHRFLGADPGAWQTHVPTYSGLQVQDLYPGIDLHYDGSAAWGAERALLKGTFRLAPGADPGEIRWTYPGSGLVELTPDGGLRIELPGSAGLYLYERAPSAWQVLDGAPSPVEVAYRLSSKGEISLDLGAYDPDLPLVVDPTIEFATYLGGSSVDEALGLAVDGARSVIVVGSTISVDFPTDLPPDEALVASRNVFVTKLSRDGSRQEFSIFLGGTADDVAEAVAVDSGGDIYITGQTFSEDFPTIFPVELPEDSGGNIFIVKLSLSGSSIRYSLLLGGGQDDIPRDIAVDTAGNAHVVGETVSTDFPTVSPLQAFPGGGETDAFVIKLAAVGNEVLYSTYLGGTGAEAAHGVAVDRRGNVLITGFTDSIDFPTTRPLQAELSGFQDTFLVKLNEEGTGTVFGTYLGIGNASRGQDVVVDRDGNAYVTGTLDAVEESRGGTDAFVQQVNEDGSRILYQTILGGSGEDEAYGIGLDRQRNAYVVGTTESPDLPSDASLGGEYRGGGDAFIAQLGPTGSLITYNYLGGGDFDAAFGVAVFGSGDAAVAGVTFSTDFPTVNPFQNASRGAGDAFVVQIGDVEVVPTPMPTETPAPTEIPPTPTPEPGSIEAIVQSDLFLYGLGGALALLLILLGVELSRGGRRRR